MLESHLKSIGTQQTMTVALLIVGFVFVPALALTSRRPDGLSLAFLMVCSILCAGLAGLRWKKHAEPAILALAVRNLGAK